MRQIELIYSNFPVRSINQSQAIGFQVLLENMRSNKTLIFVYAPINVKPEGGEGGRATHGNLIVACIPRVGILIGHRPFHLSIL